MDGTGCIASKVTGFGISDDESSGSITKTGWLVALRVSGNHLLICKYHYIILSIMAHTVYTATIKRQMQVILKIGMQRTDVINTGTEISPA
jgi:hypothetical protein